MATQNKRQDYGLAVCIRNGMKPVRVVLWDGRNAEHVPFSYFSFFFSFPFL
jgi:hypothetical protein